MLSLQDIRRLKVDPCRLAQATTLPAPRHAVSQLIQQFAALSNAILVQLLGISPEEFAAQLVSARNCGAECLVRTKDMAWLGITATTSLIKSGDPIVKSMVVPSNYLRFNPSIADHLVIGSLVRGKVEDGNLKHDDTVEVMGWAMASEIERLAAPFNSPTFQSKLNVLMVPCRSLRPISELEMALAGSIVAKPGGTI